MTFPVSSEGDWRTTGFRRRAGGATCQAVFRPYGPTTKRSAYQDQQASRFLASTPGVSFRGAERFPVGDTTDHRGDTAGPFRKGDLLTNRNHSIFFRNDVPMRIKVRVTKFGRDPVLQAFRDEVLKAFCLDMNFIPGKIEHIMKESFEQTVMAQDHCCSTLPHLRKDNAMVFLVPDKRWPLAGQLLQHP